MNITSIVSNAVGLLALVCALWSGNGLGALNVPDSVAGPGDYAMYVGGPAALAAMLLAGRKAAGRLFRHSGSQVTDTQPPTVLRLDTADVTVKAELRGKASSDSEGRKKLGALLEHFGKGGGT